MTTRKQHKPEIKARVAPESLKGEQTLTTLASRFGVHPTMIQQWKKALVEDASGVVFARGAASKAGEVDAWQIEGHASTIELSPTGGSNPSC